MPRNHPQWLAQWQNKHVSATFGAGLWWFISIPSSNQTWQAWTIRIFHGDFLIAWKLKELECWWFVPSTPLCRQKFASSWARRKPECEPKKSELTCPCTNDCFAEFAEGEDVQSLPRGQGSKVPRWSHDSDLFKCQVSCHMFPFFSGPRVPAHSIHSNHSSQDIHIYIYTIYTHTAYIDNYI